MNRLCFIHSLNGPYPETRCSSLQDYESATVMMSQVLLLTFFIGSVELSLNCHWNRENTLEVRTRTRNAVQEALPKSLLFLIDCMNALCKAISQTVKYLLLSFYLLFFNVLARMCKGLQLAKGSV